MNIRVILKKKWRSSDIYQIQKIKPKADKKIKYIDKLKVASLKGLGGNEFSNQLIIIKINCLDTVLI